MIATVKRKKKRKIETRWFCYSLAPQNKIKQKYWDKQNLKKKKKVWSINIPNPHILHTLVLPEVSNRTADPEKVQSGRKPTMSPSSSLSGCGTCIQALSWILHICFLVYSVNKHQITGDFMPSDFSPGRF